VVVKQRLSDLVAVTAYFNAPTTAISDTPRGFAAVHRNILARCRNSPPGHSSFRSHAAHVSISIVRRMAPIHRCDMSPVKHCLTTCSMHPKQWMEPGLDARLGVNALPGYRMPSGITICMKATVIRFRCSKHLPCLCRYVNR
jgi:hypothetical protein